MTKTIEQTDIFALMGYGEDEAVETVSAGEFTETEEKATSQDSTDNQETDTTDTTDSNVEITEKEKDKGEETKKPELKGKRLSSFEDAEKPEEKKAAPSKSTPSTTKKEIGDKFELKTDTIVNYAGQEVPVTRYFTVDELENGIERKQKGEVTKVKIEEKDLIKKLNQDFAELLPQLTSLVFFEKKNMVVPVLQARKKGLETGNQESSSEDSFSSPKQIPFRLLSDFIAVAKQFSDEHQTEIHADIYYDYDEQDFFMDFPKQIVHTYWADRTEDAAETALKFIERRYRKVMEVHSHHRMAPTPSSTDNANERSPILYAIVGRIDDFFPSLTVRTFNPNKQKHIPLNPWKVFEYPFSRTNQEYDLSGVEVSNND